MTPINECEECRLHLQAKHPKIPGRGNIINPKIIFIGEAPGLKEDEKGEVFIGPSGEVLTGACGVDIDNVYITNCVKCCPYNDILTQDKIRTPTLNEISLCRSKLIKELSMFDPDKTVLMTLGWAAYCAVTGESIESISEFVGKSKDVTIVDKVFKLIPNFHPAYGLYNPSKKAEIVATIRNALGQDEYKGKWKIISPEMAITYFESLLEKDLEYLVCDLETTSLIPWEGEIIMLCIAEPNSPVGFAVPLRYTKVGAMPETANIELALIDDNLKALDELISTWNFSKEIIAKLKIVFRKLIHKFPLVNHNIKFDIKFAHVHNWCDIDKIEIKDDTMTISILALCDTTINYDLKSLCKRVFNLGIPWDEPIDRLLNKMPPAKRNYGNIATVILGKYGALDPYWTDKLYLTLRPSITEGQKDIKYILNNAIIIFAEAETVGVAIDKNMYDFLNTEYKNQLSTSYDNMFTLASNWIQPRIQPLIDANNSPRRRKKWTDEDIKLAAFTPTSTVQMKELLYKYYKLPILMRTDKKEPSTKSEALKALKGWIEVAGKSKDAVMLGAHQRLTILKCTEFIDQLLIYKKFSKLHSTYINNMVQVNNQYKPEYNINGTVTGRLSSGFHTIPKASDLKRMYVSRWAPIGGLIMAADFSQLELRILAALSEEESWKEAFNRGIDIHSNTAARINHCNIEDVKKEWRDAAKTINFGIIYGKGDESVALDLGITTEEAKAIRAGLMAGAPDIDLWIKNQNNFVDNHKCIITAFNRVIKIDDRYGRGAMHRKAVNYPIQSTASDLTLNSIVNIYKDIKSRKLKSLIFGSVHDSILIDIYPGELFEIYEIVKRQSEDGNMIKYEKWLHCQIKIDIAVGYSWGGIMSPEIFKDNDSIVIKSTGNRKDAIIFNNQLEKVWNDVNLSILEQTPITEYAIDTSVKDIAKWTYTIELSKIMKEIQNNI